MLSCFHWIVAFVRDFSASAKLITLASMWQSTDILHSLNILTLTTVLVSSEEQEVGEHPGHFLRG